ncbi:diphthine--ammonia ligase isoform X2 [Argentina anserina]|uniref:diphthine--ammonia ligase isoform X2 n=1 Tax=Argentina anserina TaxID=57926 RepID=UPI0021767D95|nr:diphthine--ammonia ligase isoform X2 [Potentilla anserina]
MHGSAIVQKANTRIHKARLLRRVFWHQKLSYRTTPGDEVEDMFLLLNEVKRQIPSVTAVSSGAIASDYQRLRVESVCSRLGLVSLAYLWKQDQSLLLQEMITSGIVAITVKVAAMGLDPSKHLGKELSVLQPYLHKLKDLYGINVCGEGGEYETLTLDCPLFLNARIMLVESQVILHSSDSIAPVGVLHPVAFHLQSKAESHSLENTDNIPEICKEKVGFLYEVQGDTEACDAICQADAAVDDSLKLPEHKFHISRTQKGDTFSICCWLQDSCTTSAGMQEDLEVILKKIESLLVEYGFGWEYVLYIHLYIADMGGFSTANETYVRHITQEKCLFGVPSRSTVELPLLQVGLGNAYMEVLVANDHTKRVLHVQSISCWAPSCIGPYSQATLHKEILHMAGQLGLNPPTMTLCNGGIMDELETALDHCEAVANCFNCSIFTSAIIFVDYCSTKIPPSDRSSIHDKHQAFLKQTRAFNLDKGNNSEALNPIFLYLLLPDLPKGALVEVKPVLFVAEDIEATIGDVEDQSHSRSTDYWGFRHADWHESCIQKCIVPGKLCAVVLSVSSELAALICDKDKGDHHQNSVIGSQMDRVLKCCFYLLDKIIMENDFGWEDTMYLRFYFPTSLQVTLDALSLMLTNAFSELAEMNRNISIGKEPIFNLVPVIGAGKSSASMNDIITCELMARK